MTKFLTQAWYAVGWAADLEEKDLFPVTLMNIPMMLFRDGDGVARAIVDRCPHRFAPLSMGVHKGDRVACRYHGMEFDRHGRCVLSPFTKEIPAVAHIVSYPVMERNGVLWVWPGDAAKAEGVSPPDYPFLTEYRHLVKGVTPVEAYYELSTDNLMDLSHAGFLHGEAFGENDQTNSVRTLERVGDEIVMDWFMPGVVGAPGFDPVFETGQSIMDVWLLLRWRPAANIVLEIGMTEPGWDRSNGRHFKLMNFLTPQGADRTTYLWAAAYDHDTKDADAALLGVLKHAFDLDDKPMIEACFNRMGRSTDLMEQRPLLLLTDAGALRCRRALSSLIKAEAGLSAEQFIA